MAARLGNITFDCDDVLKMAAFWPAVLGRPLDKGSHGNRGSPKSRRADVGKYWYGRRP